VTPAEALAALERREINLRVPTVKNLELIRSIAAAATAARVVAALGVLAVPTIRPRILHVDGRPEAVLPGDPRWY
jgi:hypothetical protein